jgi:hypothetical protein
MEAMKNSLRVTVVLVLLGLASLGGVGPLAAQTDPQEAAVGRIVDIDVHHGYLIVEFPNGRMNVSIDKREIGQYIVGDEIRIDSFGRPLPRRLQPLRKRT